MIHKTAEVDKGAKIGKGTKVWRFCHIASTARIGKNVTIGQGCYVAGKVGDNCKIQNNVSIYEGVELEERVFVGPSAVFTNDKNPRAEFPKEEREKILVEKGATIGANATIVCPRRIGRYAFIGAGAVVVSDIPSFCLAYGNPAEVWGGVSSEGGTIRYP